MKKIVFLAISFAILAACTNEVAETSISFTRELTFTATHEGLSPETKTMRMDDGSTWWQPYEEISVFYGSGTGGGSKFTSQNSTLQEIVEFTGSIQMSGSGKDFWAVYPYSEDNSCDGSSITTVIPSVQTGSEGNFSGDAFPTMAKSTSMDLAFWNICGGIKFFVSRSDIKSVTFKGNDGENLAGKVRVTFNADGKPEVAEVLDGKTEVTLTAPDGGTFKAGKYYYITLLPTALDSGFSISFNTADSKGVFTSDKAQTIKRSIFGVLKNIDSKVAEWESTVIEPEWVDLGLSVKWATFNLGAYKPEGYGDYYAWGETDPKDEYNWSTYKFDLGINALGPFSKYVLDAAYGTVDHKTVLDLEDDAAHVNWGGKWRMATAEEWEELRDNCAWTWTDNYNGSGAIGRIVTSNKSGYTDKSIFLPAAGYRVDSDLYFASAYANYWTSSLRLDYSAEARGVVSSYDDGGMNGQGRFAGLSVRPVYDDRIHPESVSLNKSTLSLYVGESEQLTATVLPDNATDKTLFWSSDNAEVATVDYDGNVTAIAAGSAIITVTTIDGGLTASCEVTVINPEPEYVDLGLSVKWATFNVGATKPEEYGDYFAWGETEPYYSSQDPLTWKDGKSSGYNWASYKWCNGNSNTQTKYNTSSSYGTVDNKTVLEPEDDAAHVNWGGTWRMPTDIEWVELINNCTLTWTGDYNGTGVAGTIITSKKTGYTDKSIFLPAACLRDGTYLGNAVSYGYYWSSSLYTDRLDTAFYVYCCSDGVYRYVYGRYLGLSVRPVYGEFIPVSSITLSDASLNLEVGSSAQMTATIAPTNATELSVRWVSSDDSIVTVDQDGNVSAVAEGTATVTAYASNGLSASCEISVKVFTSVINGHEAVDLGLPSGLKWATMNVGANKPEEYGDYFAWGETEPYYEPGYAQSDSPVWKDGKSEGYNWASYKWCNGGDYNKLTKYCTWSSYWDSSDPMDNKTVLEPGDDAAQVNWGGSWRMPTDAEWTELIDNCTWTWTSQDGVNGRKVTGPNGNSIFLPAVGARGGTRFNSAGANGLYRSSSLSTGYPDDAWCVNFNSDFVRMSLSDRSDGLTIRPVSE